MLNPAAIELREVTRNLGNKTILDKVSLEVPRGDLFAVLGPSGAGKTTLARLVNGVDMADFGQIFIEGVDVTNLPARQRNVNTVFQNLLLFPHLTIFENVAYGLRVKGLKKREIISAVNDILEFLGLLQLANRKPDTVSGGEQQRTAIARALVNRPAVLICDEPLTSLDPLLRRQIRQELVRIKENFSNTLIFITHDHEEALAFADRIAIMREGEIVQIGTPREIYEHPKSIFTATFVGEINLFEKAAFPGGYGERSGLARDSGPGYWGIRPEKLRISRSSGITGAGEISLKGNVLRSCFCGPSIKYEVFDDNGNSLIIQSSDTSEIFPPGNDVTVSFRSEALIPLPS